jgi:type IV secretory pathway VirB10-like protein
MTEPTSPNERLDYSLDDPRPKIARMSKKPLGVLAGVFLFVLILILLSGGEDATTSGEHDPFRAQNGRSDPWWEAEADGVVALPVEPRPPKAVRPRPAGRSASLQAAMDAPLRMELAADLGVESRPVRGLGISTNHVSNARENPELVTNENAPGSYSIKAGSLIPATLLTAIQSDLPGPLVAQVSNDVRDTVSSNFVLIPKGTRLLCQYAAAAARGQDRLVVSCRRLILPNGESVDLPGEPGVDLAGTVGVPGEVNRHLLSTFGTGALLAVVSGGVQLSQGSFDRDRTDAREVMAGALTQQLGQTTNEILRRELNRTPTITVEEGTRLQVFVTRDLDFLRPYAF